MWRFDRVRSVRCVRCRQAIAAGRSAVPDVDAARRVKEGAAAAYRRIGVSFAGVGNRRIVQMIQGMRDEAALHKEIGQFIFTEADWKAAKQVSDVEDLLIRKIDLLIIGPISEAIGAPLIAEAAQRGIPVVTFGACGGNTKSTVEIMGGGLVFGRRVRNSSATNCTARGRSGRFAARQVSTRNSCAMTDSARRSMRAG
ncbi:substrate-binding domain-containing protein [Burkholderia sp. JP2-270]|uniref:substrate-binding domain-containing protein n=1 Tax=Burkholderia sp. JP2-270 TaxID=2217913 RepID=UPI0013A6F755|nr:substrate-binding domain-containing protein [Burkholderia sp. JP2-270]